MKLSFSQSSIEVREPYACNVEIYANGTLRYYRIHVVSFMCQMQVSFLQKIRKFRDNMNHQECNVMKSYKPKKQLPCQKILPWKQFGD